MDDVFRALADPIRRLLLDRLFMQGGLTLTQLIDGLPMTRQGASKHLRLLTRANLVVVRRQGREKLHYLNAVPIRQVHDRWISKFAEARVEALLDLQRRLEGRDT